MSQYKSAVKMRYKDAITHAHIIAYMTDPRFLNSWETVLEEHEIQSAEEWLRQRNEVLDIQLEKFKLRLGNIYAEKMFSAR